MLEARNAPIHVACVTLIVRDLAACAAFYRDGLGLAQLATSQTETHFGAAGGEAILILKADPDAAPAQRRDAGLFHTAFLLPARADLARWIDHARRMGLRLEGASDHLVSEAVYLSDPEGNGIEVYVDRPRALWPPDPAPDGPRVAMATNPLDGAGLMAEIAHEAHAPWRFPTGGGVGHVHLKVGDLAAAEAFYTGQLGMAVMARYPGAVFLSWGGYHHHVAVNVWSSQGAPPRQPGEAGLGEVAFICATPPAAINDAINDPAGNRLIFQASASIS
jgi:catechol 2,3-dioxygenase